MTGKAGFGITSGAAGESSIEHLRRLIADSEDRLMEKILGYAKQRGYVKYTSTLKEAWRLSVSGLSRALLAALRDDRPDLELGPDDQFADDAIAGFGIMEARLHRGRGISLGMFLGLMKYYRQGYKDLVREAGFAPAFESYCLNLVERFFDRMEIAFCVEWSAAEPAKLITELQEKNRRMTNEKNRYLTIFESNPHMVFILDNGNRVNNMNHSAARRFYSQEIPGAQYYGKADWGRAAELRGESGSAEVLSPGMAAQELLPWLADDLKAFVEGRLALRTLEKKVVSGNEELFFTVTFSQILDVSEKFSGVVVVLEDITERKRTERELRDTHEKVIRINEQLQEANRELRREVDARKTAEEASVRSVSLLKATLESTADGILVVDRGGRIVDCNERFLELWRLPRHEIVSRDNDRAQSCFLEQMNNPGEFLARVREVHGNPEEESLDVLELRDGRVFERYSRPQRVGDRVTGRVWSFRDITERKRCETERLEMERRLLNSKKLESLGVLAGGIAHDFNNLLTVILGNLEMTLLGFPLAAGARGNIAEAMGASQRAVKLIRQMLDFTGKGWFVLHDTDLNDVVCKSSGMLRGTVPGRVALTIVPTPDLPWFRADQDQVRQVLLNLVSNAAEAMGEGTGEITVRTGVMDCDDKCLGQSRIEEKPRPGRFIYLEVSDTGCGMDEETQARIFEPFFTTKFMGRGLGMSAVLGIVREHGGAILLQSGAGRGSVFRILFPVSREAGVR